MGSALAVMGLCEPWAPSSEMAGPRQRLRLAIRGAVQGVGFRPFVFRLATELGVMGFVRNGSRGVVIEAEGPRPQLETFRLRVERDAPPRAFIQSLEASFLDPVGHGVFSILPSVEEGAVTALVLPDIATCPACLGEVFDPRNRRFRYPFTNCTNCGPRFSIIESLPYDRPRTTMKRFTQCAACEAEYADPRDRRFHAQPNACPHCGPQLALWDAEGGLAATGEEALRATAEAIRQGAIAAVKGIGGFHLMVDARNDAAVCRLRARKHRDEKPFALMAPSVDDVRTACAVSPLEERLLRAPEAPIVLLQRRMASHAVAPSVAPRQTTLGCMLPANPLHHLLMADLGGPVVATSGNRSEEPICTDEREALWRLEGLADLLLVHDRPIHRPIDDSIVRVMAGRELVLRRARGFAPLPVTLDEPLAPLLAVGAHLKNTVAVAVGRDVLLSQHLGNLETPEAIDAARQASTSLQELYGVRPRAVACDAHPDYVSTRVAEQMGVPVHRVQHHEAHVRSCLAENGLRPPILGVAWDGTGYGTDGMIWGGEFLAMTDTGCVRVAHLRPFGLPGGEQAVREPRRCALSVLYELAGEEALRWDHLPAVQTFTAHELALLGLVLTRRVQTPLTTSVGRLFDAVAALLGVQQHNRFEGQAAMALEALAAGATTDAAYPLTLRVCTVPHQAPVPDGPWVVRQAPNHLLLDWAPMVEGLLEDLRRGVPLASLAAMVHNTLAEAIAAVARRLGERRVALSGGCFQNRLLTERTIEALEAAGLQPYWHQRVPPNDGGIALGQLVAASGRR